MRCAPHLTDCSVIILSKLELAKYCANALFELSRIVCKRTDKVMAIVRNSEHTQTTTSRLTPAAYP